MKLTARSAAGTTAGVTSTSTSVLLLPGCGSLVCDCAATASFSGAPTRLASVTTSVVKVALAPAARVSMLQVTVVVVVTTGAPQFQPAGTPDISGETTASNTSATAGWAAAAGPLLLTVLV